MGASPSTLPPPMPLPQGPKRVSLEELIAQEHRRAHRRTLTWIMVALGVALVGGGVGFLARPKPVPLEARFRTQPVSHGAVVHEVNATGRLEAVSAVSVGAEISGRIASVEVDYNSQVKAGQVLARFDRTTLDAQLAQTKAMLATARAQLAQASFDLEQAKRNEARATAIFEKGGLAASEHETAVTAARLAEARVGAAKAQVAAQEAALEVTRSNLDHAEVRAPVDGIVITRNVDPGQTVAAVLQSPQLFLVASDLLHMRVIASVDEADIGDVREGQSADFTVTAWPDRVFHGVVTEVRNSPVIVQDVVSYGVVVTVDNPERLLRPGMTASVRVKTAEVDGADRVPNAALHFTPPGQQRPKAGRQVYVLEGEQLRAVPVVAGISDGELTQVTGAPAVGTKVLVDLTPEGRRAYGANASQK